MPESKDCRECLRVTPKEPVLCVIQAKGLACNIDSCTEDLLYIFADAKNLGQDGALLQTPFQLVRGTVFNFSVPDDETSQWRTRQARVVWTKKNTLNMYLAGIEFLGQKYPEVVPETSWEADPNKPSFTDLSFFIQSNFLQAISQVSLSVLLNSLRKTIIAPGDRLISQGDPGDCFYLIQKGTCVVYIEHNQKIHKIARLKPGDVVGEMAVLTGEPRTANVDAETEMVLWKLDRNQFECLAYAYPDLRLFLTEIMANRFDNSIFMRERAIGKYLLINKIGKGGWGIVYRGLHKLLKMPVAIKMMRHDMAMEPLFLETFRREAETIARLRHPNIVSIYDIEEMYKTIFIIMEYLEGVSLKEYLDKVGPLSVRCCANILVQVCDGLSCAHKVDVVHRDIKPANIFIMENDHVKLLDFGLACAPGTEDMNIAGTLYYASPEQIEGSPVDQRSDIYSMGIMAYEMVTGKRPYPEDNLADLMEMHCHQDIPDPVELVPGVSEAYRKFVLTCCQRDKERRYQDTAQARKELLPIITSNHAFQPTSAKMIKTSLTTLVLLHAPDKEQALKNLLEELVVKANELDIDLHVSEFRIFPEIP
jgi:eukaryotic-like serine/threonine-protein kinase